MSKTEPKIILYDLETLPILSQVMKVFTGLSAYPGLTLKASINSVICFGYREFGVDDKAKCLKAWDFKAWNKDVNNDYDLLVKAREILSEADAVVTHNGKRFDQKFFNTRLLINGLKPLHKIPHIDTCQLAKQHLYLFNNRLGTLGEFLAGDKKMDTGGWSLWEKVMAKEAKSMRLMADYCKQDVDLLCKVFKKLRPFATNIPNYNLFTDVKRDVCSHCGSTRVNKHGLAYTKTSVRQRYQCLDCNGTMSSNIKGKFLRSL